jgi:hypothetical protein
MVAAPASLTVLVEPDWSGTAGTGRFRNDGSTVDITTAQIDINLVQPSPSHLGKDSGEGLGHPRRLGGGTMRARWASSSPEAGSMGHPRPATRVAKGRRRRIASPAVPGTACQPM